MLRSRNCPWGEARIWVNFITTEACPPEAWKSLVFIGASFPAMAEPLRLVNYVIYLDLNLLVNAWDRFFVPMNRTSFFRVLIWKAHMDEAIKNYLEA